jgi:O-antigen ligase
MLAMKTRETHIQPPVESRFNVFSTVILFLTLGVPLLVLPMVLDNAFNTPKTTLMLLGATVMVGIYASRFLLGKEILFSRASTHKVMLLLVLLNVFSFFYTANPYYTLHAAMMNLTCLAVLYFVSLYVDGRAAFLVVLVAAISGVLVSIETYLQFMGVFVLFKWAHYGIMVMGTIGNSNYLGAYLVFPLFALAGLVFLLKGRLRLVPLALFLFVLGALLFTRARAGWFGFFLSLPFFLFMMTRIHGFRLGDYIKSNLTRVTVLSVVAFSILVGLWYAAPERFHVMMGFENVTNPLTFKLRIKKYSAASLWLFKQNPLFGTGLWSYRNMVFEAQAQINQKDPDFFKDYPEPKPESVHNEYLEVLNDGGLMAYGVIFLFLLLHFRHAWRVIRDEALDRNLRILTATAFSAVVAILLAAFFFFPFRINSTFFMTVLMMGLVEGAYARAYGRISVYRGQPSGVRTLLSLLLALMLAGTLWYKGVKPFQAEVEHFRYKRALATGNFQDAERHLLKAIAWDPHNTTYNFFAAQLYMNVLRDFPRASDFIEKATLDYNGDIIRWVLFYIKGLMKFQSGSLFEAQAAFERSLYYNPMFGEAAQKLEEVKKVIRDHDRVLIKFR